MFVKFLKSADCQWSHLYDREPFNQWSNEPDIRRTVNARNVKKGEVVAAVYVKPMGDDPRRCEIYLNGSSEEYLQGVPWHVIEIYDSDPRTARASGD